VQQIRGLLDAGLTTDIVRRILPFLEHPGQIAVHPDCLPETAALLREEAARIQRRIDCLARNRDAMLGYLDGMCIALMPLPAVALTVGSVTDATVLPACSGTDAK
jgi:hypothetical protein